MLSVHEQGKLFLSRDAAADTLSVSTRSVDMAIRDGRLDVVRWGRRVLVRRDSLDRFAAQKVVASGEL
jgi:excisionase family DNA binding protein